MTAADRRPVLVRSIGQVEDLAFLLARPLFDLILVDPNVREEYGPKAHALGGPLALRYKD